MRRGGVQESVRTIADLGHSEQIRAKHIAEAVARRPVTRQDQEGV
jgi:predicted ATPase with chaperone activity